MNSKLGEVIKRLRKQEKWTQGILAEKANVSVSFVSQVENGEKHTLDETFRGFAKAFGIPTIVLRCMVATDDDCDSDDELRAQVEDLVALHNGFRS